MFAKVFVLLVVSIAVALAAQPLDYNCPASKSPVHAGCKVNTNFSNKCSEVQQEMKNRINGQKDGRWQDPHNNGTYAVISETTELFELSRTTGDGKYTDMINFVFGEVANGVQCNVFACSEYVGWGWGSARILQIYILPRSEWGYKQVIEDLSYQDCVFFCV